MTPEELAHELGLKSRIYRYSEAEHDVAVSEAQRLGRVVVLGDHNGEEGEYWVVIPDDAQKLVSAGYERELASPK